MNLGREDNSMCLNLGFHSESVSHSLILMMMHVVWIFGMVTLYGGMCVT